MNELIEILSAAAVGYLLGSVNFSIILSRAKYNDDIRRHGSGNAGMTNTLRTYGKLSAVLVLLGDAAKGALAGYAGYQVAGEMGMYIAGLFAVVGHMFPVFFQFRGGKGVATAAGFILYSNYVLCLALAVVFLLVIAVSRYVSLGSITVAVLYPFAALYLIWREWWMLDWLEPLCPVLMAVLVIWAHRGNIKRLLSGTENKLGQKAK